MKQDVEGKGDKRRQPNLNSKQERKKREGNGRGVANQGEARQRTETRGTVSKRNGLGR